ncbi:MAG: hypothetical protein RLZ75_1275 [Pseudomonadota bacterium]
MQNIATALGFHYTRLTDTANLKQALQDAHIATLKTVVIDRRWQFATLALSLLMCIYLLPHGQRFTLKYFTKFRRA